MEERIIRIPKNEKKESVLSKIEKVRFESAWSFFGYVEV